MLTYAMTVLAANKQARLSGQRATFGRVDVRPNGTNAVPSAVTAWLDARAETPEQLDAMLADVERLAQERAGRDGTALTRHRGVGVGRRCTSTRPGRPDRRAATAGRSSRRWPGTTPACCPSAGIPTAMLFVRNPTGISHSPDEHAETADCLAGVDALADTLERLA